MFLTGIGTQIERFVGGETSHPSQKQAVRVATQYASAPASLTIISCKYKNRQRL